MFNTAQPHRMEKDENKDNYKRFYIYNMRTQYLRLTSNNQAFNEPNPTIMTTFQHKKKKKTL